MGNHLLSIWILICYNLGVMDDINKYEKFQFGGSGPGELLFWLLSRL